MDQCRFLVDVVGAAAPNKTNSNYLQGKYLTSASALKAEGKSPFGRPSDNLSRLCRHGSRLPRHDAPDVPLSKPDIGISAAK
jgi:hypothetical protein